MFKAVSTNPDFSQSENRIIEHWNKSKVVKKYLNKNQNSKNKFSFIDGPITANNPMGVHHAWGRTYKDLWQRFFNMRGFAQRFQNGFDEQGLWVEVEVERELGLKNKKDIENLVEGSVYESLAKFVNLCKDRAKKFSSVQTDQSKRLGYFMDWDNSYHTSSDENNYAIWYYLKIIHEKGWLYKGRDSVPWCPRCGTAISQHEILTEEYKEVFHKSLYFKLPLNERKNEYLLVWTTTPWTIPGNVSVAVDPKKEYVTTVENLIVLKEAAKKLGLKSKNKIMGKDLIGLTYIGPFDHLPRIKEASGKTGHKVIGADELITEEGTGLVHIAPGAGEEDFKLSKEQKLPVIELIDEGANYLRDLGEFSGKNAKKHPEIIINYLKNKDKGKYLFKVENYKHRYPNCWRCKTELVWRVVDEWYINMDGKDQKTGTTYREMIKTAIKPKNRWIPDWGYDRELDWLNNMHDWLISKKRYWGLALPIWECKKCGNFDVLGSKDELRKKSIEGWDKFEGNSPHRPWVDQVKIKCSACGEKTERVKDVGNPWLDAGIVPFSTLKYFEDPKQWKEWFPADFITESFPGQFKNWFYSLLAMSVALSGEAPFKKLLGYGSVRDEKGEEMHKSKGNAIEFNEAAEKIGVDVMRWLYLRTSPEHNVNFGYREGDEVRRFFHLRLWNVYSFFVTYASLASWKPSRESFKPTNILDKWIISRLNASTKAITKSLERFDAFHAVENAETFIVSDLSNWYVRRIRDRVGPTAVSGKDKDDAFQTLWEVLTTYTKLLAPMIPFLTEEIYKNLTDEESVHLSNWPEVRTETIEKELEEQMHAARQIVEATHASRKENEIKVRQPLASLSYKLKSRLSSDIEKIISQETNVKQVNFIPKQKNKIVLDTKLTTNLKKEGEARDLIRKIQGKRKEAKVLYSDKIFVYLPSWPQEFEEMIMAETLANKLIKGNNLQIEKIQV